MGADVCPLNGPEVSHSASPEAIIEREDITDISEEIAQVRQSTAGRLEIGALFEDTREDAECVHHYDPFLVLKYLLDLGSSHFALQVELMDITGGLHSDRPITWLFAFHSVVQEVARESLTHPQVNTPDITRHVNDLVI